MVSIARICEKFIERKPFLQEALSSKIINYGALADIMLKDIEAEYGKPVKHAAVMMALRRLQEKLQKMPISQPRFTADCNLTIISDLFEVTIIRHPQTYRLIDKFYDIVDPTAGDFFTVTTGAHEITIISSKKYKNAFMNLLDNNDILLIVEDLAAVTVKLPREAAETPGIFYLITRALTWENINIVEVVSTYTEDTVILKSKDVGRGYEVLLKTMREHQN